MLFASTGRPFVMSATKSISGARLMSELIQPSPTCEPHPQLSRRTASRSARAAFRRRGLDAGGIEHVLQDAVRIEVLRGDLARRLGVPGPFSADLFYRRRSLVLTGEREQTLPRGQIVGEAGLL